MQFITINNKQHIPSVILYTLQITYYNIIDISLHNLFYRCQLYWLFIRCIPTNGDVNQPGRHIDYIKRISHMI